MIEITIGAVAVALAFGWRLSFDAGRAHQRRLSVLNPGEAIVIGMGKANLLMTPPDFERIADRDEARDGWFLRSEAMFRTDPLATMKVTGVST